MTPSLSPIPQEQYVLAIISVEESAFPEMRRVLAPTFKTTLASTEEEIKSVVEDQAIHAILFDLDSIGEGASDGIDVLKEIRALREDVVLVTMSKSTTAPFRFALAGRGVTSFFSPL